jgi:UDP-N-acetyl-D-mannosaminuronic acid transferase (WecB/TagA/CpsF family)
MEEMFTIRPQRHMLYLLRQNKRALNAIDNKKMIAKDGITMYAYGHHLTPQIMAGEI